MRFVGIVLVRSESTSDVIPPTQEEKIKEESTEDQEKQPADGTQLQKEEQAAAEESGKLQRHEALHIYILTRGFKLIVAVLHHMKNSHSLHDVL